MEAYKLADKIQQPIDIEKYPDLANLLDQASDHKNQLATHQFERDDEGGYIKFKLYDETHEGQETSVETAVTIYVDADGNETELGAVTRYASPENVAAVIVYVDTDNSTIKCIDQVDERYDIIAGSLDRAISKCKQPISYMMPKGSNAYPENSPVAEFKPKNPDAARHAQKVIDDFYYFHSSDADILAGRTPNEWRGYQEITRNELTELLLNLEQHDNNITVISGSDPNDPLIVFLTSSDGHNFEKVRELQVGETFTGKIRYGLPPDSFLRIVGENKNDNSTRQEFVLLCHGAKGAEYQIVDISENEATK